MAHEFLEVDSVALAVESKVDARVRVTVAVNAVGDAGVDEHVDAVHLEDARSHGALDLLARAVVDVDRVDSRQLQHVGKHEAGGAAAHDADGGVGDGAF